ncbi:hypothetical protein SLE2022_040080 [Rubroshorea leprosula]
MDGKHFLNVESLNPFHLGKESSATLEELNCLLDEVQLRQGQVGTWKWKHSSEGSYSVKSEYAILTSSHASRGRSIFNLTWNPLVAFNWEAIHDRVPTRSNLFWRGILDDSSVLMCAFCGNEIEDLHQIHMFLQCKNFIWCWDWMLGLGVGHGRRVTSLLPEKCMQVSLCASVWLLQQ